jgi:hypothetical protein
MTDLRKFGILFSIIFAGLAAYFPSNYNLLIGVFVALSLFFIFATIFNVSLLTWPFKKWMNIAQFISHIVTPLIFLILYLFVIVPIGFLFLITNKRSATKNIQETYWELRGGRPDSNMNDQF